MVAPTCFGITLPSSGSVPSAFREMLNWGAVDRILWMGVLCLVTWCVAISDIIAVWLTFFFFFLFCRIVVWNVGKSYAFCNLIFVYTFLGILCGMVAPSVYRASDACSSVETVAALCWSLQNLRERWWVWNKVGALLLTWVLSASVCCLPSAPSYSESFEPRPFPGNIYDTFPTGTWPGTT
jgi:hypothetical protein